jgi:YVTN family beta-propeller protein
MAGLVEHPQSGATTVARGKARPRRGRLRLAVGLLALAASAITGLVWADRANTALERTVAVGHFPWYAALVGPRERFFVANSSDGTVSVLDTRAGGLLRTVPVGGQPGQPVSAVLNITALVADTRSGQVFVATSDNSLTTLDDRTGARVRLPVQIPCLSGLAVDGRTAHVFAGDCLGGAVRMFDARSGRLLATIAVGGQPHELAVNEQTGRVFVAEVGGMMSLLDAASGRLLRSFPLGLAVQLCLFCTPSLPQGPELVTDGGGGVPMQVYVLDATTGRLLRTVTLGLDSYDRTVDPQTGQIVLVGGPTGVSGTASPFSGPGRVVILDGHTGRVLRRLTVHAMPGAVAVDARRHRVLLGLIGPVDGVGQPTGIGSVEVRDARSWRVLRTVPAGIIPWTITVDARTDRAFVINANIATGSNGTFLPTHVRLPEGWWPATERSLKGRLPWLPLHLGPAPVAPTTGTVTVLDLARL